MHAGTLWVVESSRGRQAVPAVPKREAVARLPKLLEPPATIGRFEAVQLAGTVDRHFESHLQLSAPVRYELHPGRDIAAGHAIMFSTFVWLQEHGERQLLKQVSPSIQADLLLHLQLRERESYYIDNTYGDRAVDLSVRARVDPWHEDSTTRESLPYVPMCLLTFLIEMHEGHWTPALCLARHQVARRPPQTRRPF